MRILWFYEWVKNWSPLLSSQVRPLENLVPVNIIMYMCFSWTRGSHLNPLGVDEYHLPSSGLTVSLLQNDGVGADTVRSTVACL